jgi:hypothetical protein
LRDQGQRGFDDVAGSRHHGLGEDDIVVGSRTASQAWGQCLRGRRRHRLGLGKMVVRKGLDRDRE